MCYIASALYNVIALLRSSLRFELRKDKLRVSVREEPADRSSSEAKSGGGRKVRTPHEPPWFVVMIVGNTHLPMCKHQVRASATETILSRQCREKREK